MPECSVEGCHLQQLTRGWCEKHYERWRQYGDPLILKNRESGTGSINENGYLVVSYDGVQRLQHRVVMEGVLGRPLEAHETVHHRNGDKLDNRAENLELWSTWQPYGQRVEDKVAWAKELLWLYEPSTVALPSSDYRIEVPE